MSLTSENKRFQVSIGTRGFNAEGGHNEKKGLSSAAGDVIQVAQHRHEVQMNVVRFDAGFKYQISPQLRLEATLPYEIKSQDSSIPGIDAVEDPDERTAMLRNRDIHHRNATYRGISDMDILLGYTKHGIIGTHDTLTAKFGSTIPFGKTEEDPWVLGDMGKKHLHLQFGTGTFNPIANLRYNFPVYGGLSANASVRGKMPFYENSKAYRGSWDVTYTGGLNYRLNDWLSLQTSYLGLYQSYAYWQGEKDINTGLRFSMASLGASIATPYNVPISIMLMLPIQQETLYDDDSDAFQLSALVSVTALYSF